ncbi:hypothetical protein AAC387_Pa06g1465 [Persea americana]
MEDVLRAYVPDFGKDWEKSFPLCKFTYNNSYHSSIRMAPFEALNGWKCKTPICWEEIGVRSFHGPSIISDTNEKVKRIIDRLKIAKNRQKSYAYLKRRDLEFKVEDNVFLKISPTRGTMRFGQKGKLAQRYIGPFEIDMRVGEVAYRLILPVELARVHRVFHVFMWRKYIPDPTHMLHHKPLDVQLDVTFIERPKEIIDTKEHVLRTRTIHWVKVQWKHHSPGEETWELRDHVKEKYPDLLPEVR